MKANGKIKEVETGGSPTFMNSPVIFKMNNGGLSFNCYTRQIDYTIIPEDAINPLGEALKQPIEQPKLQLKPNKEFDIEPNKHIEPKAVIDNTDWFNTEDDEWNI